MVVLPVPGAPSTRNRCSRENPPDRISSSPQIPVLALLVNASTEFIRPLIGAKPPWHQTVPQRWNYFCGKNSAKAPATLERFQTKWRPVRVKKTRQIKNLEPRFDSIETEKALAAASDL